VILSPVYNYRALSAYFL